MISELKVFLVAMSPVVELRGAIPLALKVYHLPLWLSFFLSVAGNLVPLIGIVVLGKRISDFLSGRFSLWKRFFDWLFSKVRGKTRKLSRFGKDLTVVILTALPIPFVGGWTGALTAVLLEVSAKRSCLLVTVGVIIAGIIVTILSISIKVGKLLNL